MKRSQEQRVEELSKKIGGRFKLTVLVEKQMREYHLAGRAFMPDVRNTNELFDYILDQVEDGQLQLLLPSEEQKAQPALP